MGQSVGSYAGITTMKVHVRLDTDRYVINAPEAGTVRVSADPADSR